MNFIKKFINNYNYKGYEKIVTDELNYLNFLLKNLIYDVINEFGKDNLIFNTYVKCFNVKTYSHKKSIINILFGYINNLYF